MKATKPNIQRRVERMLETGKDFPPEVVSELLTTLISDNERLNRIIVTITYQNNMLYKELADRAIDNIGLKKENELLKDLLVELDITAKSPEARNETET